ncbi:anti-sigma factor domain-containing protein [Neobacillus niacini]|uniref:anti-sigma factor domain-containing protein n=1 Tax=Neobacillus niacini TaxID=86668 RepID=UPI001471DC8F|nr:anti-sigma factor domain-containing protein [Neobacillus niacini]MEC1524736.1 anti-sigma factor domain-containing protein [Neobacillus niacini]
MEVNDPYVTFLTSEGEFLRARKLDRVYSIGEEIDFFPVTDYLQSTPTASFKNFFTLKKGWIALAVLLISVGSFIPVYQSNKAYAYMSIDTSTSIEMGLNKDMQVVELKGFNKEAEKIISKIDWKKMDVSELTTMILTELKEDGYITQAEPVLISTVKTDKLKENGLVKLEENIKQIKETVDKNIIEVNMYTSTQEEVEKAQDSGVPVGLYHKNKNKNNSAKDKESEEKVKRTKVEKVNQTDTTPSESSSTTALPPGQQKKQEQDNNLLNNNQQVNQNQSETIPNSQPLPAEQGNGNQAAPGLNKDGNDKHEQNQWNHRQTNKQDKQQHNKQPQTNNHGKNSK